MCSIMVSRHGKAHRLSVFYFMASAHIHHMLLTPHLIPKMKGRISPSRFGKGSGDRFGKGLGVRHSFLLRSAERLVCNYFDHAAPLSDPTTMRLFDFLFPHSFREKSKMSDFNSTGLRYVHGQPGSSLNAQQPLYFPFVLPLYLLNPTQLIWSGSPNVR